MSAVLTVILLRIKYSAFLFKVLSVREKHSKTFLNKRQPKFTIGVT